MIGRQGLRVKDVQRRASEMPDARASIKRVSKTNGPLRHVDQQAAGLHPGQGGSVDHAPRLVGQRGAKGQDVERAAEARRS
jgi:hypothetical protein